MKNVKIVKAKFGNGYFLTIGDDVIHNRWATTVLELLTLLKMLKNMQEELEAQL